MKTFYTLLLVLFANSCFAVGWEEVSRESAVKFNIAVKIEVDTYKSCNAIYINLPEEIFFDELGVRKFWGARYNKITVREKGWQLMTMGTQINLPTSPNGSNSQSVTLCLSNEDLKYGYISAGYSGGSGAPPMVVIIHLSNFR